MTDEQERALSIAFAGLFMVVIWGIVMMEGKYTAEYPLWLGAMVCAYGCFEFYTRD